VRLTAIQIPDDPIGQRWPRTVLDDSLNRMHNHWHVDFDGDGTADTLTASQEGVYLIRKADEGWSKTRLAAGYPGDAPQNSGAGEIKTGRLQDGSRYIATIEPMHGTDVVVYTKTGEAIDAWHRSQGQPLS